MTVVYEDGFYEGPGAGREALRIRPIRFEDTDIESWGEFSSSFFLQHAFLDFSGRLFCTVGAVFCLFLLPTKLSDMSKSEKEIKPEACSIGVSVTFHF